MSDDMDTDGSATQEGLALAARSSSLATPRKRSRLRSGNSQGARGGSADARPGAEYLLRSDAENLAAATAKGFRYTQREHEFTRGRVDAFVGKQTEETAAQRRTLSETREAIDAYVDETHQELRGKFTALEAENSRLRQQGDQLQQQMQGMAFTLEQQRAAAAASAAEQQGKMDQMLLMMQTMMSKTTAAPQQSAGATTTGKRVPAVVHFDISDSGGAAASSSSAEAATTSSPPCGTGVPRPITFPARSPEERLHAAVRVTKRFALDKRSTFGSDWKELQEELHTHGVKKKSTEWEQLAGLLTGLAKEKYETVQRKHKPRTEGDFAKCLQELLQEIARATGVNVGTGSASCYHRCASLLEQYAGKWAKSFPAVMFVEAKVANIIEDSSERGDIGFDLDCSRNQRGEMEGFFKLLEDWVGADGSLWLSQNVDDASTMRQWLKQLNEYAKKVLLKPLTPAQQDTEVDKFHKFQESLRQGAGTQAGGVVGQQSYNLAPGPTTTSNPNPEICGWCGCSHPELPSHKCVYGPQNEYGASSYAQQIIRKKQLKLDEGNAFLRKTHLGGRAPSTTAGKGQGSGGGAGAKGSRLDSGWVCEICNTKNFPDRQDCYGCARAAKGKKISTGGKNGFGGKGGTGYNVLDSQTPGAEQATLNDLGAMLQSLLQTSATSAPTAGAQTAMGPALQQQLPNGGAQIPNGGATFCQLGQNVLSATNRQAAGANQPGYNRLQPTTTHPSFPPLGSTQPQIPPPPPVFQQSTASLNPNIPHYGLNGKTNGFHFFGHAGPARYADGGEDKENYSTLLDHVLSDCEAIQWHDLE